MSWDVSIKMNTGDGANLTTILDVRNLTYNNSALLSALHVHPKQVASDCPSWVRPLKNAIQELQNNPEKYTHLEPKNNWGGIKDTRDFLVVLLVAVSKHSKALVVWE